MIVMIVAVLLPHVLIPAVAIAAGATLLLCLDGMTILVESHSNG